jgi:hypothetical protein
MPVHQLGLGRLVVSREQRDRLHRHAMSRQQRDERVPQLPRHPRPPRPRGLSDHPELPPHIVIVHRRPDGGSEYEVVIEPDVAHRPPPLTIDPGHDMIPAQRPDLFRPQARSK